MKSSSFRSSVVALATVGCLAIATDATAQSANASSCIGVADAGACINSLITSLPTGGEVLLPRGVYTLQTSVVQRHNIHLRGEGVDITVLRYSGGVVAIDAVGSLASRRIIQLSKLTIDGNQATGSADGVWLGHNHRSNPALDQVKITGFPRYGLYFKADNWIVSLVDVEFDQNGRRFNNGAGIYKDPAVADLNAITFVRTLIEGNGSASSAAGGAFLQSGSGGPMKGLVFRDCTIEGNFGTDQVYVTGASNVVFDGVYLEADLSGGNALVGIEIANSTGSIANSRFAVGSSNSGSVAVQIKQSPTFSRGSLVFSGPWGKTVEIVP